MYIQKLLQVPQSEETILLAEKKLQIASLTLSAGVETEKIATLQLLRNNQRSSLATFTISSGGTQRNLLPLIPANFQLEPNDELAIQIAPSIAGEEEWIGISGYTYSPEPAAISAGIGEQLTAIQSAIAQLPEAIAAALPGGSNENAANSSFVNSFLAEFKLGTEKLIDKSGAVIPYRAGDSFVWRTEASTNSSSITLGPYALKETLLLLLAGITYGAPLDNRKLRILDFETNEELIPFAALATYGLGEGSYPYAALVPTPGLTGRMGKIEVLDTSGQWIGISPVVVSV